MKMKTTLVFSTVAALLGSSNIATALQLDLSSDGMLKPISRGARLNPEIYSIY